MSPYIPAARRDVSANIPIHNVIHMIGVWYSKLINCVSLSSVDNEHHPVHTSSDAVRPPHVNPLERKNAGWELKAYGDSILRLSFSYVHDVDDAEDILQDTLNQYMKKASDYISAEYEKAWLLREAIHISKHKLKDRLYHPEHEWSEYISDPYEAEEILFVWGCVSQLPSKYREIIHLYYREGYSPSEIKRMLNRNEAAIRKQLNKARDLLKKWLEEDYDFDNEISTYNLLMEHIKVTSEMEERIMSNLQQEHQPLGATELKPFLAIKKFLLVFATIAACAFGMIYTLSLMYPFDLIRSQEPIHQLFSSVNPLISYNSIEALSEDLPFELYTPTALPEEYTLKGKYILFDRAAELSYFNGSEKIIFRMMKGNYDLSGDWNVYSDIITVSGNNYQLVTLKGEDGLYKLAIWRDDKNTFALKTSVFFSEEVFRQWIESIVPYSVNDS